jgi:glycosyltransferase involved in cell wall biosynthesis
MKVLHCTHSLSPLVGGPSRFIEQAALLAPDFDLKLEALCLDEPGSQWLEKFPCKVTALGPGLGKYGFSPRFLHWLKGHAAEYDVIVVNGLWQFPSLAVWLAICRSRTPYVVFPHGMLDPWFNRAYPLKHLKKLPYWKLFESRVIRDAAAVLFTSQEERLLAAQAFKPYRANDVVIGYGTSDPGEDSQSQRKAFLQQFPELSNKRILLFLGRLHEKKGCDLLVEAFARQCGHNPDLQLVLAGPEADSHGRQLRERVSKLSPEVSRRVVFAGMLSGDSKWGALRQAEILCLPSHQENFGQVVSEALSCGTPVILSDKVNIWREVVEGAAGICNSDDLAGTEASLSTWLNLEEEDRLMMRKNARSCFENHFEMRRFFARYREYLGKLI